MIASHLLAAWRAFQNQKLIYSINIAGLTIALAVCLLMLAFARYESSYDQHHPDAERIYNLSTSEGSHGELQGLAYFAQPLLERSPDVEAYAPFLPPMAGFGLEVVVENTTFKTPVSYVNERFLSVFTLPFTSGDPATAFDQPNSVVITEQLATTLFGTTDVLGQTLSVKSIQQQNLTAYAIRGVVSEPPQNSVIRGPVFLRPENDFIFANAPYGVKLKPGVSPQVAEKTLNAMELPPMTEYLEPVHFNGTARLSPFYKVHLDEQFHQLAAGNDLSNLIIIKHSTLVTIALALSALILAIACANYVNLYTASTTKRTREIALRKVMGASRGQLAMQFLTESIVLAWLAALLAAPLISMVAPRVFHLLGLPLTAEELFAGNVQWQLAGLITLTGILAGAYPAWHISHLPPTAAFQGGTSVHSKQRLTQLLVVAQFAVVCLLLSLTLAAASQVALLKQQDHGYNPDNLYGTSLNIALMSPQAASFMDELNRLPEVTNASLSAASPAQPQMSGQEIRLLDSGTAEYTYIGDLLNVDEHFFELYRPTLIAGRFLSKTHSSDSSVSFEEARMKQTEKRGGGVVLAEPVLKQLGIDNPDEIIGQRISMRNGAHPDFSMEGMSEKFRQHRLATIEASTLEYTVVGISSVVDFGNSTFAKPIMAYTLSNAFTRSLSVRTVGKNPAAEREQIEKLWERFFPAQPLELKYVPQLLEDDFRKIAKMAQGLSLFAGLAIVIACLGLFAMTSFSLVQRSKEIGVRKVLGASGWRILRLLGVNFSKPVLLAILLALAPGYLLSDWLVSNFPQHIDMGILFFVQTIAITLAIAWGVLSLHMGYVLRLDAARVLKSD